MDHKHASQPCGPQRTHVSTLLLGAVASCFPRMHRCRAPRLTTPFQWLGKKKREGMAEARAAHLLYRAPRDSGPHLPPFHAQTRGGLPGALAVPAVACESRVAGRQARAAGGRPRRVVTIASSLAHLCRFPLALQPMTTRVTLLWRPLRRRWRWVQGRRRHQLCSGRSWREPKRPRAATARSVQN